ncbi:MAG: hypothetical protein ACUVWP_01270 [bacterium]
MRERCREKKKIKKKGNDSILIDMLKIIKTIISGFILLCFINLSSISYSADILIWDNDTGGVFADPEGRGTVGTEYAIREAIIANGWTVDTMTTLPQNLSEYKMLFCLFGFYPFCGRMSGSDEIKLVEYLQGGGAIYIEGGDFSFSYRSSELFSYTKAKFENDGRKYTDGNVDFADGVIGTILEGISMEYSAYKKSLPDNYIDEISANGGKIAMISRQAGKKSNGRIILNRTPYKIIYSTFIFGVLKDSDEPNTKKNLMCKYLIYLQPGISVETQSIGIIRSLFR